MDYCVECDSGDKHKEWCSEAGQHGGEVEIGTMATHVEEVERYYHVLLKDGGMYLQRKDVWNATDSPLSFQEIIIIKLCKTILGK